MIPQLVGVALLVVYIAGIWRFIAGFGNTFYSGNKIILGLFWPVLIFHGRYRQEFFKALKG